MRCRRRSQVSSQRAHHSLKEHRHWSLEQPHGFNLGRHSWSTSKKHASFLPCPAASAVLPLLDSGRRLHVSQHLRVAYGSLGHSKNGVYIVHPCSDLRSTSVLGSHSRITFHQCLKDIRCDKAPPQDIAPECTARRTSRPKRQARGIRSAAGKEPMNKNIVSIYTVLPSCSTSNSHSDKCCSFSASRMADRLKNRTSLRQRLHPMSYVSHSGKYFILSRSA